MRTILTLVITKAASLLSRGLGRGTGAALPGLIAEKIDPGLAARLAGQLPKGVVLVTGTNGKTTTTKLIIAMLEAAGEHVLVNRTGSNLRRGVISALIANVNLRGRTKATIGLFEVDEASMRLVAPLVNARHIVVTNLFRDQLDRYGELDTTAALIGQGIAASPESHLYLNADDPLVASLAKYAAPERVSYFGIDALPPSPAAKYTMATDSDRCPVCGSRLNFDKIFYGHIGHYACPTGDFARPVPRVDVTQVDHADLEGTSFTLAINGESHRMSLPLAGTYNLYNALGAVALGAGLELDSQLMASTLATAAAAFGRVEKVELEGRVIYLLLVKNPAGFTQVAQTFLMGGEPVLMIINDNFADGRDVSWLWDVPLEMLAAAHHRIWSAGDRGADMALRLKYAGIDSPVSASIEEGLNELIENTPAGGTSFILPTYTAMLALRKLLAARTTIQEVKQ